MGKRLDFWGIVWGHLPGHSPIVVYGGLYFGAVRSGGAQAVQVSWLEFEDEVGEQQW
jgi:hypothetical protein